MLDAKRNKCKILALACLLAIVGCSEEVEQEYESSTTAPRDNKPQSNSLTSTIDANKQLNQLYLDYESEYLGLNPIEAIFRGNMQYNDQFGDPGTDEYYLKSKQLDDKYLSRLLAISPAVLLGSDRVSYDIFKYNRELSLEAFANGSTKFEAMMPVNQLFGMVQYLPMLGSGQMAQPFHTVKDYKNWISRAKGFSEYVDLAILRMQQGVEKGIVMPTILMEKTLPQLDSIAAVEIEKSPFYMPIKNLPKNFSDDEKQQLTEAYEDLIHNHLSKAYSKLANYIKNDYMQHTRETHGLGALPGGKVSYEQAIRNMTTTNKTAEEIHKLGISEANRLFSEMKKVKQQVNFAGDMPAFFEHLKNDKQFYFGNADDLIQGYEDLRNIINPKLDTLFSLQPKTDYIIKKAEPYREKSMPLAQYVAGAPDGSRPGIFYVNTYKLETRPKWMMEALSVHEASPGHHFQISINQEAGELPPFRRFGGYSAYSEGWGLYTETLGLEMGLYKDPYQYFGVLYAQIWRANRLVVDTGLHSMGWSREDAIAFMSSNSPVSENEAMVEVERYMAFPGQALSYMIGSMKIKELRAKAEKALGKDFDIKDFHYEILADGAMPLRILEQKIDRWIKTVKSR